MATTTGNGPGTGLAKATPRPSGTVITTAEDYSKFVEQKRSTAIVLSPATDIGSLPPQWALVPSAVQINTDIAFGEVYADQLFCKGDEVALTKVGLRKIARAAGLSWTVTREDSGTVPHYWAMKCTLTYRGHDGQVKTIEASYEWDLRDDSPRLNKFKDGSQSKMGGAELSRARLNGYRRCEAGAINAAIREFGLKQKYKKSELVRPFVVFNLVFLPDTTNAQQMAMVTQAAVTGTTSLYPGHALPVAGADAPVSHAKGSIVDQETGHETDEPDAADDKPFEPVASVQTGAPKPKSQAYHIANVVRRGGGAGFYITTKELGDDERLFTNDEPVAMAAHTAMQRQQPMALDVEGDANGKIWIVGFGPAPAGEKL